jgi:hypothetical protein
MLELVAAYGKLFFHNRPSEVMKSKRTIYRKLAIRFSICYLRWRHTNIGRQNYFFSNFQFQLAYIFSIFHSNFFKFASLKFKKKKIALRAMSDLLLNWRASKFHFYLFQLSILYFFNRIFVNFIYSNFQFFDHTKVKRIILQIVLRISIFHLRKFTCEFGCSSEPSEITFPRQTQSRLGN